MSAPWLKQGAAVLTAVIVTVGLAAGVIWFMASAVITADQGLPILTLLLGGATGFLWGRASAQGAVEDFREGLHTTIAAGSSAGAVFPGSPATGDHFYRTDLGAWFEFDGSTWIRSVNQPPAPEPSSPTPAAPSPPPPPGT